LNENKKLNLNTKKLKYVHIRRLNNNKVWKKNPSFNPPPPKSLFDASSLEFNI
jgi:hypothetical protein